MLFSFNWSSVFTHWVSLFFVLDVEVRSRVTIHIRLPGHLDSAHAVLRRKMCVTEVGHTRWLASLWVAFTVTRYLECGSNPANFALSVTLLKILGSLSSSGPMWVPVTLE